MRYKTWQKVLVIVAPFAVLGALALIARFVLANVTFPPCISLTYLHFYCPGCGSTRAVRALLEGNLLLALRQNLSVPAAGFVALLYYIEFALKIWGVRFRIPPLHNKKFVVCLLGLWFVFLVLRNFIPAIAPVE